MTPAQQHRAQSACLRKEAFLSPTHARRAQRRINRRDRGAVHC